MEICFSNIIPSFIPSDLVKQSQVWGKELSINKPEKVLVYAESGKGKTSLINVLTGKCKDYTGSLQVNGNNIKDYGINELAEHRRSQISVVPQGLMLFEDLSSYDNIIIKNRISNIFSDTEIQQMAKDLDVGDFMHKKAANLSYGQKQRVAIIRALCQNYDFLLLDEPFSHLDVNNSQKAWNVILKYADMQNAGIIITSLSSDTGINYKFDKQIRI